MTLEEQIQKLTAERDEEKAIVDRVWAALGISTYEQAKPLAIDEHVKRIVEERDAAMKAKDEAEHRLGHWEVQHELDDVQSKLADCKALADTIDSDLNLSPSNQAPGDRLRSQFAGLLVAYRECREKLDEAQKRFACFKCDDGHTPLYCLNCAREGYISHQALIADIEREVLDDEGAMYYAKENGEWDRYSRLEGHKDGLLWVKHHLQALAHAERLTGKETK